MPPSTGGSAGARQALSRSHLGRLLLRHRGDILRLAHQYGLGNVRVFGSVARGDIHPASDIDLLVDIVGEHVSLLDIIGFKLDVGDLLHVNVDAGLADSLKPRIKPRIEQEVVAL